jgi:hypothetical protein
MTLTFLFAMIFHHEPDKPTTFIASGVLFSYGIMYLIIGKYFFASLEFFTGLGWIILYKLKRSDTNE